MPAALDCIDLTRRLIRCPSVTPAEGGALDLLQEVLEGLGFTCHRLPFGEPDTETVDNLYARLGEAGPNLCYAGHTDVVPVGDPAHWSVDPFAGELRDGWLYGRGAVDMKGAIAAFVSALSSFLARRGAGFGGSLSLLITGDEEGPAVNGTRKVLDWLAARGETLDACLVGEPTSDERLGDMIKIGRRGSMTCRLSVRGTQGHTAYPHLADNPLHPLVRMLAALTGAALDQGSAHFPPSSLQLTTIDVGNPASNVIPAQARAAFNIRFNDAHSGASLERWLRARLDEAGGDYGLEVTVSGESFLCPPGPFSDLVSGAVRSVAGFAPALGTTGGTSDARFIKDHATVAELGLLNATAHKVDERVSLADLEQLTAIYGAVLDGYFTQ
ncbi:MAG: succinyl-diaminopimelate desuccinylase [Rhodospirillales bacterium]|nr:succinyl-diaminopimelate desuccinylase [Rhodospirillales bacterium]